MFAHPRTGGPSGRAPLRAIQPGGDPFCMAGPRKAAPSAPLPAAGAAGKQGKLSARHRSPPRIIRRPVSSRSLREGEEAHVDLTRGRLLGEGGFARVYAVEEADSGLFKAVKVISKDQLKSSKNKGKLFAEIKLHQSMDHPYIVKFEGCFEDRENVYMQLELCEHGSLLDLLRRRTRYTEPEARLLMVQLLAACSYMHTSSVIHRDLKLGNLLFANESGLGDSQSEESLCLKVADFGLAALVKHEGERRKTICGTPNYIAPEILFDQANGHSFEVDIWSVGVILYTLLIGKPPFQTKDVKEIYKKIKDNAYTFPNPSPISPEATDLISLILNKDPSARPSLAAILEHPFFLCGPFPAAIPCSALESTPDFSFLTRRQSERNFREVRKRLGLDTESLAQRNAVASLARAASVLTVVDEQEEGADGPCKPSKAREAGRSIGVGVPLDPSRAAREQRIVEVEAQAAMSPASPIADLLRSARKPLYISPRASAAPTGSSKENRDSQLGATSRAERKAERAGVTGRIKGENDVGRQMARIVSGMCEEPSPRKSKSSRLPDRGASDAPPKQPGGMFGAESDPNGKDGRSAQRGDLYSASYLNLQAALEAESSQAIADLPRPENPQPPKVFISSWVDYTHKYGTAYALTNGSAGLYFNDSTTMVLSANLNHFDYISNRKGSVYQRKNYTIEPKTYPAQLDRKAYLLEYFEEYMAKTLQRDVGWTFRDVERTRQLDFLVKYYRMKNAIVFKLSNDVIQINFWDHQKLLLTEEATVVTFINADLTLHTYAIGDLFREADKLGLFEVDDIPLSDSRKEKRRDQLALLLSKLEYARDVLGSLAKRATKNRATSQS